MEHSKVYGEKCRQWRTHLVFKQEDMAHRMGLRDAKAYSRYESGETAMTLEFLESASRAMDLDSVNTLLSIDERFSFQHCEQANAFSNHSVYYAASAKEREQLIERIKHLEEEVLFLRAELLARRSA